MVRHSSTQRALLVGAIDYAGLFPPAGLSMVDAVRNFLEYASGPDAWALGRFVVPLGRVSELAAVAASLTLPSEYVWPLSVLVGSNATEARQAIDAFATAHSFPHRVSAVEAKATTVDAVSSLQPLLNPAWTVYVEIPYTGDLDGLVRAVGSLGACVKFRTGSTTSDGFPTASQLARALIACRVAGVPFKATAGLHHPMRAEYPLTYAMDAERGTMFGYLNVVLAAVLAAEDESEERVAAMLEEREPSALSFTDSGVTWREHEFTNAAISAVRGSLYHGFGSCSFREPMDEFGHVESAHAAASR